MQIIYNPKPDILSIRLNELKQAVINQRVSEGVVLDMGNENKIVGIEIMDASSRLDLKNYFPCGISSHSGTNA